MPVYSEVVACQKCCSDEQRITSVMIVAYVKLVASEGHVTISLLILDAVRELQVVEHLPVALDEVEASDGPSQVSGISETPGGSQGG